MRSGRCQTRVLVAGLELATESCVLVSGLDDACAELVRWLLKRHFWAASDFFSLPQVQGRRWHSGLQVSLTSAETLLSRVQAPPPSPWPDGGHESLRSP
ncbi:hypothetical protein PoB_000639800 [Plakobranchus ocellatus]|uniref:Uncharacterized protein n=1 Tax=Plakobranchus ocellatus TaxID=259542 RepID=A0AAV3YBK5_9GAST|nr:hypothetical protein PoB_000639800 [Plakobranchus ocellatus]